MAEHSNELAARLAGQTREFMNDVVLPREDEYYAEQEAADFKWTLMPSLKAMRAEAKQAGLWCFPIAEEIGGRGLTLTEYAPIAETMALSPIGTEVFNCYSGTISNILVLAQFGDERIHERFLKPLVAGEKRSCISITEREVSSSDPTELKLSVRREGDEYVLSGTKSWATGAIMPECDAILVLGCTSPDAPRHERHSLVIVPRDSEGLSMGRLETVMGFEHAPFGHVDLEFDNVRVPVGNLLGEEGHGFAMMQTTLGFGRVQLGMGSVGYAERALADLCEWAENRIIGGQPLIEREVVTDAIARSRIEIEQARQHLVRTAHLLQTKGPKAARSEIAQAKVLAPNMALGVIDRAMQFHGGAGLSHGKRLAEMWAYQRSVRIGEGADEVHRALIAKLELRNQRERRERHQK
jgi:acyl-CoA dehydrogenase